MAKVYHVDLTEEERVHLTSIVKKRLATSESVKRSNVLLAADRLGEKAWKDIEISKAYQVKIRSIERLRKCFVNDGFLIALNGKPRLNIDKITFNGEVEAKLVALRCSEPECGRSGWALRLLSDRMVELSYVETISHETVRQILKKMNLNPGV